MPSWLPRRPGDWLLVRGLATLAVLMVAFGPLTPITGPPPAVVCFRWAALLLAAWNLWVLNVPALFDGVPPVIPAWHAATAVLAGFGAVTLGGYVWYRGSVPSLVPSSVELGAITLAAVPLAWWASRAPGCCGRRRCGLHLLRRAVFGLALALVESGVMNVLRR
jgi:hypothetical protein